MYISTAWYAACFNDAYNCWFILVIGYGLAAGKKQHTSGGLSGGELKRLSVGLGIMSNPNVLFLIIIK